MVGAVESALEIGTGIDPSGAWLERGYQLHYWPMMAILLIRRQWVRCAPIPGVWRQWIDRPRAYGIRRA
jgi:hypothetical protein